MYKELLRKKERFQTTKGNLSLEQLWDLTANELNDLAVALDSAYEASGKKSYITTRSVKDKTTKQKFDVVIDILNTKLEEAAEAVARKERKEKNAKILAIIADKEDESLKGKTKKQLLAMLDEE